MTASVTTTSKLSLESDSDCVMLSPGRDVRTPRERVMSNAAQAIWDRASSDADRVALRGASEPWTYGRLRERAAAVASRLREAQVAPGDRVLLVAPSVPEFAGAYFGVLAAGAIAV